VSYYLYKKESSTTYMSAVLSPVLDLVSPTMSSTSKDFSTLLLSPFSKSRALNAAKLSEAFVEFVTQNFTYYCKKDFNNTISAFTTVANDNDEQKCDDDERSVNDDDSYFHNMEFTSNESNMNMNDYDQNESFRIEMDRIYSVLMVIELAEEERNLRSFAKNKELRLRLAKRTSELIKEFQHEKVILSNNTVSSASATLAPIATSQILMGSNDKVCKFFLRGRCKKGAQCRFHHPYLHMCPWCGEDLGNKVTSHLRACAALSKKNAVA